MKGYGRVETALGVTIWSHSNIINLRYKQYHLRGKQMQQIKKQSDRERQQYVELVDQYRAIGPAALVAALLHTKKRKTVSIVSKAA